jgi:hypothetical protein
MDRDAERRGGSRKVDVERRQIAPSVQNGSQGRAIAECASLVSAGTRSDVSQ